MAKGNKDLRQFPLFIWMVMMLIPFNLNAADVGLEKPGVSPRGDMRDFFRDCLSTDLSDEKERQADAVLRMESSALEALPKSDIKSWGNSVAAAIYFFGCANEPGADCRRYKALLRVAAIGGDPTAMGELADSLYQDRLTRRKAPAWFFRAARRGDEESWLALVELTKRRTPEAIRTVAQRLVSKYKRLRRIKKSREAAHKASTKRKASTKGKRSKKAART